jgi:ubiquinone/menaquinone biosynthesis C-methylase UbiE
VNRLFDSEFSVWEDIYQRKDLASIQIRERHAVALRIIEELSLPTKTRVLEIGCGAGFMAIALARKGFTVDAVDSVPKMLELTQAHARQAGVDNQIHATLIDANDLAFRDQSFNLIVALGVIPWLHDLKKAMLEIARVLVTGGHIVMSSINRYGAYQLIDPLTTPAFKLIRKSARRALERSGLCDPQEKPEPHNHSIAEFKTYLQQSHMVDIKNTPLGFGPFTFLQHNLLPNRIGIKVHYKLLQYANTRFPILCEAANGCIIVARKK